MKKSSVVIIALLIAGVCGFAIVEGYVKPKLQAQQETFRMEQKFPATHHFDEVLKYKNEYMGNASNLSNLNNSLPLYDIDKTFQLYPDESTAKIIYEAKTEDIDAELLKQAIVYNSTANFVLIDNLSELKLFFADHTFTITRDKLEQWYNMNLDLLQDVDVWEEEVRMKVTDQMYVADFLKHNVSIKPSNYQ